MVSPASARAFMMSARSRPPLKWWMGPLIPIMGMPPKLDTAMGPTITGGVRVAPPSAGAAAAAGEAEASGGRVIRRSLMFGGTCASCRSVSRRLFPRPPPVAGLTGRAASSSTFRGFMSPE